MVSIQELQVLVVAGRTTLVWSFLHFWGLQLQQVVPVSFADGCGEGRLQMTAARCHVTDLRFLSFMWHAVLQRLQCQKVTWWWVIRRQVHLYDDEKHYFRWYLRFLWRRGWRGYSLLGCSAVHQRDYTSLYPRRLPSSLFSFNALQLKCTVCCYT